jgi:hypothetical protein
MCVACALSFAGVRHKGVKARAPKAAKVSWSERRRRKNRPTVPTVTVPESALEDEFDLGSFETMESDELISGDAPFDNSLLFERSEQLVVTAPTTIQGLEALLAVPLPKRSVAI